MPQPLPSQLGLLGLQARRCHRFVAWYDTFLFLLLDFVTPILRFRAERPLHEPSREYGRFAKGLCRTCCWDNIVPHLVMTMVDGNQKASCSVVGGYIRNLIWPHPEVGVGFQGLHSRACSVGQET